MDRRKFIQGTIAAMGATFATVNFKESEAGILVPDREVVLAQPEPHSAEWMVGCLVFVHDGKDYVPIGVLQGCEVRRDYVEITSRGSDSEEYMPGLARVTYTVAGNGPPPIRALMNTNDSRS